MPESILTDCLLSSNGFAIGLQADDDAAQIKDALANVLWVIGLSLPCLSVRFLGKRRFNRPVRLEILAELEYVTVGKLPF